MAIADLTPEAGVIQTFLAKGLISAHAAVQAESFERRKEILGSPYDNWSLPTLESGRVPMLYEAEDEESLEAEEFIYRAFWPENDTGPEHAWRWAHQKIGPEEFFPFDSTYSLRKFAYVVWDMDRISALDIFSQPWEPEDPTKLHAARRQRIEQLNQKILDKISKMI